MKYFVVREITWPNADHVVRIISDLKHMGRGVLPSKFEALGEGRDFIDPRLAAKCAIKIRDAWNKIEPSERIQLAFDSDSFIASNQLIRKAELEFNRKNN